MTLRSPITRANSGLYGVDINVNTPTDCSHPRFSSAVGARQKGETRRAQELRRKGYEKG